MSINRRSFIQTAAAVTASLATPMVMASGKPRVVVVGGGAGGVGRGGLAGGVSRGRGGVSGTGGSGIVLIAYPQ